jgi:serine/threonine protein kinase
LDVAEGLAYLHANRTTHGDLKGASSYSTSFLALSTTFEQPNILIDHSGHARLTDFGFASVVRGVDSVLVTQVQGYTARWAAPEVLESGDRNTREADAFAFGMVVIEVGPRVSSVLATKRGIVRMTSASRVRFLPGNIRSASSRPQ